MLSAMVHGGGSVETAVAVALAATRAVHDLDQDRFLLYFGLICAALSEAARKAFEMLPEGLPFFNETYSRGLAEAKAADVIAFLEARELTVSDAQRERIIGTTDLKTLDRWVRRAATIASTDDLFE